MGSRRKYSLKEQVGYLISGKLIGMVLQFSIPIILVRLISKEDYGVYLQFLLIGQFFGKIIAFTLPSSLYYFFPHVKGDKNQLITQTYFLIVVLVLLFIPVYFAFRDQISMFFNLGMFPNLVKLCSLYIVFTAISSMLNQIFVIERKSDYVIRYEVINIAARVILLISSFLIFKTVLAMIWSQIVFYFIRAVLLFIYLNRNYQLIYNFKVWKKNLLLEQIKFTYPLGLANIVNKIGTRIDKFILATFFSSSDFAIYSISQYRVPIVNLIFPSVSNVIIPEITRNRSEGNITEVIRLWHKMIVYLAMITIPVTIFFFVIAQELILLLYTDAYIAAVPLYRIVLLTLFILILRETAILTAFGKTKTIFYVQFIGSIVGTILGFILIKKYGTIGAATSFTVTFFVQGLLMLYMSKRVLGVNFYDWLPWKKLSVILLTSLIPIPFIIPVLFLNWLNIITIIISFIIYLIVITPIYHVFKIVDVIDLKNKILKKKG
jgi:O-antigen/teichoic acid export membrane protein